MKAALYMRVSSEDQIDNFSIAAQTRQLQEYCQKNNIEIYGEPYIDDGISAKFADESKRPEFDRMIKDAEKKLFQLIIVHKYDRFARNVELSQKIKRKLKNAGVNVVSITEPIQDSPIGFVMEGILEIFAEYYIRNLAQESKKGHVERARQGLHNGSVPYGYKIDNGNMVINKDQTTIVKKIFELYNNEGYGSTKIAMWLNQKNIPTAVHGQWNHFTVNRILKNVKYIGKICYDGEIYNGHHEPIIPVEEFELAQRNITQRTWKTSYRGANFEKFLLLGLLRCGECGCVFTLRCNKCSDSKRKNSLYYYLCNGVRHMELSKYCANYKCYSTVLLEKRILNEIEDIKDEINEDFVVNVKTDLSSVYESRKIKIQNEWKRAKDAYLSGVFSINEYNELKTRYENELEVIEISKTKDNAESNKSHVVEKIQKSWDKLMSDETTIPEKRKILQEYIDVILVYKDKIIINFWD